MKKLMIGLIILFSFQFCTSELNEIDELLDSHVTSGTHDTSSKLGIPNESFLAQYFSLEDGNQISSIIENRINHDFKRPLIDLHSSSTLGAKWTGNFNFKTGDYNFSVKSNKSIRVFIDDNLVLDEKARKTEQTYGISQALDGIHQLVIEYNLEELSELENVESDSSEPGSTTKEVSEGTGTQPVKNGSQPKNKSEENKEEEAKDSGQIVKDNNESKSENNDDSQASNDKEIVEKESDPVVEVDNGSSTVEVEWEKEETPQELKLKKFEGQTVITKGGVYSGIFINSGAGKYPIIIKTSEPVTIKDSKIISQDHFIYCADGANANLTVVNCYFEGIKPNDPKAAYGRVVRARKVSSLVFEHNHLYKTGGIFVHLKGKNLRKIKVRFNYAEEIIGREKSAFNPGHNRQFFHMNGVHDIEDCEISWNYVYNSSKISRAEDVINIFESSGTKNNPILIHSNLLDGAYKNYDIYKGAYTGGGIMAADTDDPEDVQTLPEFIKVYNNTIVRQANHSAVIGCGRNCEISDNVILVSDVDNEGKQIIENQGKPALVAWNRKKSSLYQNNIVRGNLVAKYNGISRTRTDWALSRTANNGDKENTRFKPGQRITKQDEDKFIEDFLQSASKLGITMGLTDARVKDVK